MTKTLEIFKTIVPVVITVFAGIGLKLLSKHRPFKNPLQKFFNFLNVFAMWCILPVVVFFSIARFSPGMISGFVNAAILAILGCASCFVSSVAISHVAKDDRGTTIALALNSAFMNVTYLGFPVVYSLLGPSALGPAAIYAVGVGVPHVIFGTVLMSSVTKRKITAKDLVLNILTFPAAFALIVALLFVLFNANVPSSILNVFDSYLTLPFFLLLLLLVGYLTPIVRPRKYREDLITVGVMRFLLCPLITYLAVFALGLAFTKEYYTPKPSLIQSAMPPAVFNVLLASHYKHEQERYGAVVFYLTLLFLFVVFPVISVVLKG
ncbi:MAG: AEC family transporter [Candidatus Hadarchaeales archaeon]